MINYVIICNIILKNGDKYEKNSIDLGNDSVGKLVIKLAIPAIVAQLINLLYNLVDRMYVGRIENIGTEALAGLGIVLPITLIITAFSSLVGMGGSPLASIYLGEQEKEKANKIFNISFILLLFLA